MRKIAWRAFWTIFITTGAVILLELSGNDVFEISKALAIAVFLICFVPFALWMLVKTIIK